MRPRLDRELRRCHKRWVPLTIYQYPNCSTCKKALKFLAQTETKYTSIDIVKNPPTLQQLRALHLRSGLPIAKLFNTSGESYRAGGFSAKLPTMTHDEALAALAADGKLIKRPLIDTGKSVIVGFSDAARDALAAEL